MSNEPTTKPSELAEILDNERAFRLYVVQKLERATAWQDAHDIKDDMRFDAGDARMSRIEANVGGVSSGVGELKTDKANVIAVWKAAAWGAGIITSIILALVWVGEKIAQYMPQAKP